MSDHEVPPATIQDLWYRLDKRLALIEAAQADHKEDHAAIEKRLDDHDWLRQRPAAISRFGAMRRRRTRIRSGLATASLLTGAGGLFSLIAIIRSFMP
jgi:hypothetical protein